MPGKPEDATKGNGLIVLSMVLVVATVAAVVFVKEGVLVHKSSTAHVELFQGPPMDAIGRVSFIVSNASEGLSWSSLRVLIDGKTATYDHRLVDAGAWCVRLGEGSCMDTATFNAGSIPVRENQTLMLHLKPNGGKVALVEKATEGTLWAVEVKGS